jgi:hypothetical protein
MTCMLWPGRHGNAEFVASSIYCLRWCRQSARLPCSRSLTRPDGEESDRDRDYESVMDGTGRNPTPNTTSSCSGGGNDDHQIEMYRNEYIYFFFGVASLVFITNFEIAVCSGGGGRTNSSSKCWYCESVNSWPQS